MTKLFLLPGGLICDAVGLTEDGDNRQILRMFLNTLIWGAAGVITILLLPFWASTEIRAHVCCASPQDRRCDRTDGHQCTHRVKLAACSTARSGRSPAAAHWYR